MSRFMLNVVIRRRRRSYGAVGVLLEAVVPGLNHNGLLCLEFVRHNISLAVVSDRESGTTSPHNRFTENNVGNRTGNSSSGSAAANVTASKEPSTGVHTTVSSDLVATRAALIDTGHHRSPGMLQKLEQQGISVTAAISERDVFTWTLMLAAYAKHGLGGEGFKLYEQVRDEELKFDKIMYTSVVSVCASLGDLEKAKSVHQDIIRRGIELDAILEGNLVHMYARCRSMKLAHEIFDKMVKRNFVAWTAMIAGSAQHGTISETFELFQQMQQEHVKPDSITYISLLNACTSPAALKKGQWVYNHIIQAGLEGDVRLGNALINMFTKCGSIQDAQQAFDRMKFRDVISWNTMINSYAEHGPYGKAIEVFHQMQQEGIDPDRVTFVCFLKACANQASLAEGKWAHGKIQLAGLGSDLRVGTALIDMYAKCGSIVDALHVFHMMPERNTVTWSAMIVGLGQHGHGRDALQHYHQMLSEGQLEKTDDFLNKMPQPPAAATWKAMLGACSLHIDLKLAEHAAQMLLALELQDAVAYVSLSHVYTSAGLQQKATLLWKLMQDKGVRAQLD
ncbi:unnamed protein product [Sphagnum jensenii]|uniref:Pentatricopeptide repeat-containing protein n=1 Tax=Sphagnum jensenii TaxID=128206 RepID=A0ABP1AG43_9BRYO